MENLMGPKDVLIDTNPEEQVFYICTVCKEKMLYHPGPFRCKKLNCKSTNFKKWLGPEAYACS